LLQRFKQSEKSAGAKLGLMALNVRENRNIWISMDWTPPGCDRGHRRGHGLIMAGVISGDVRMIPEGVKSDCSSWKIRRVIL
jgi:hypothetical protein